MARSSLRWRAAPDGCLGVFAAEPLAAGDLVERCYCLPLRPSTIPGQQLPPWLYDAGAGAGADGPLLFPLGWGLLYNEGEEPNVSWVHEAEPDDNAVARDYIVFRARLDVPAGAELLVARRRRPQLGEGLARAPCRDMLSAALRVLAQHQEIRVVSLDVGQDDHRPAPADLAGGTLSPSIGIEMRCSPLHGNGVFATGTLKVGDVVELAPTLLVQRWELGECLIDHRFAAAEFEPENSTLKVALGLGSVFNHCNQPNLGFRRAVTADCHGAQQYTTCYYALRDIVPGEELFISYGRDWWKSRTPEQVSLGDWRLRRGETREGRPFYDAATFQRWLELFGRSKRKAELIAKWLKEEEVEVLCTVESVEAAHRAFVEAEDDDVRALETWRGLCGLLKEAAAVHGALNTPLRESGERATHRAAALGQERKLRWLVLNRADINAATAPALELSPDGDMSTGLCPAHMAAMHGQIGSLAVLLSAGADLNCRRPDGATPLDFAEDVGETEAAEWLLRHGAQRGVT